MACVRVVHRAAIVIDRRGRARLARARAEILNMF
jgi:hypothetical protein